MKLTIFCILAGDFILSVMTLAFVFHLCMKRPTVLHSLHYAVDTMTLRGRLPEPPDTELTHPVAFKIAEDVATLSVFVLLGFGLRFYARAFEAIRLRYEFRLRAGARTWQEWLREHHPEAHDNYYGSDTARQGAWKRFKRWLHSM